MILKMVGGAGGDRIRFDTPDDEILAKQIGISQEEIEKETIDFETSNASIHLYLFDKLNLVLFYDLRWSYGSVIYVCTTREEALKVFREQTIEAGYDEYSGDEEKKKVEKILDKYGLLNDLRIVFQIFEQLGGEADLEKAANFVASKGLDLGRGYPSVSLVQYTEDEEQKNYVASLADILETRGYLKRINDRGAWRVIKQIDF